MTNFAGMTVNERLFEAGLMAEFDEAARQRDQKRMIEILKKVELPHDQAEATSDAIISSPATYGY